MRFRFLFISLFFCLKLNSQEIIKYFDYKWKETIPKYAAYIGVWNRQDTLWERRDFYASSQKLQMLGHYTDTTEKVRIGTFYFFHPNGNLSIRNSYDNGKLNGVSNSYYENGTMKDSAFYENGVVKGDILSWHQNGNMKDSTAIINDSMKVYVEWFDNGIISCTGRYKFNKASGTWVFCDRDGHKTALEKYENGIVKVKKYYSVDGAEIDTIKLEDKSASFQGGTDGWLKYLTKNLYTPKDYKLINTDKIVVNIHFEIDEEGNLVNAMVITPFHDEYDKIAMKVFNNCPKWKPAFHKNRSIKTSFRQAVFFAEAED